MSNDTTNLLHGDARTVADLTNSRVKLTETCDEIEIVMFNGHEIAVRLDAIVAIERVPTGGFLPDSRKEAIAAAGGNPNAVPGPESFVAVTVLRLVGGSEIRLGTSKGGTSRDFHDAIRALWLGLDDDGEVNHLKGFEKEEQEQIEAEKTMVLVALNALTGRGFRITQEELSHFSFTMLNRVIHWAANGGLMPTFLQDYLYASTEEGGQAHE